MFLFSCSYLQPQQSQLDQSPGLQTAETACIPPKSMAWNLPLKPTDGFFVLCKYLMLLAGRLATMTGPTTVGQGKGSELWGQARMTARKTRGSQEEEESELPVA